MTVENHHHPVPNCELELVETELKNCLDENILIDDDEDAANEKDGLAKSINVNTSTHRSGCCRRLIFVFLLLVTALTVAIWVQKSTGQKSRGGGLLQPPVDNWIRDEDHGSPTAAVAAIPQEPCSNCCQGSGACTYNVGTIADGACNADSSCTYNTGTIAARACNGKTACTYNNGHIEPDSCGTYGACSKNEGTIAHDSCNAHYACMDQSGTIGSLSCNDMYACKQNHGTIGNESCGSGHYACSNNGRAIGNGACTSGFLYICAGLSEDIPDGYDPRGAEWQAEKDKQIQRAKNVTCSNCCRGQDACTGNTGTVGDNSCNEYYSCRGNRGKIGLNSCTASHACMENTGIVADEACTAENACLFNSGNVGSNACQGYEGVCADNDRNIPARTCITANMPDYCNL